MNDFWMLREYLIPMNETVKELPIRLSLYTLPGWQWQLLLQMNAAFQKQVRGGLLPVCQRVMQRAESSAESPLA